MPYVEAKGIHTYYERHGAGRAAVLLHGAAMVAEGWQPQIETLSKHFTVYVPERRGVGRTPDIDGDWSYVKMAEDTAAFMDGLGIADAAVVGLSDGGIIGLIVAYSRPDLISRLIVSGANYNSDGMGSLKKEVEEETPEAFLANAPSQVLRWIEIHRRVSPDRGADIPKMFEKMKRMWLGVDIPISGLASIKAPTLVMAGDRDMIPILHTVELWSAIPGALLCIAPGADHFWLLEMPALANRIILDFLSGRFIPRVS